MIELWTTLAPILLADAVNPVLFAFMVYAASTERPVVTSSALLVGHTVAYLAAGFVIALGIDKVAERLANPRTIDFVISLAIGLLLLWVGWRSTRPQQHREPEASGQLTPAKAFGFGAAVNFIGIPFALPYFAAIDQILKADLATAGAMLSLVAYNALYALPFIIVPLLVAVLGDRSQPILERIKGVLDKISNVLMPVLLMLIGLALVVDALTYFVTGEGLV
ncbi:MAG: hypothetical protein DRR03_00705 [Gammaproteobacteria bacterium]|nr:MAG: hypothetical protein DRR03_00705 [Gammaproteobacteria bacterium]